MRISVSAVKNVSAKDLTVRFSMAVPGTLLRWCPPMIGKHCMESHFPIHHPRHQAPDVSLSFWTTSSLPSNLAFLRCGQRAALNGFDFLARLLFDPFLHLIDTVRVMLDFA